MSPEVDGKTSPKRRRILWSKNLVTLEENLNKHIGSRNLSSLTRSEYEKIRKEVGHNSLPSYQTILSLTPNSTSFADSLNILTNGKIKLTSIMRSKTGLENVWSYEEISDALLLWIQNQEKEADGGKPNLRLVEYDKWRKDQGPLDLTPSSATIYSRFGGWKKAIKEVRGNHD